MVLGWEGQSEQASGEVCDVGSGQDPEEIHDVIHIIFPQGVRRQTSQEDLAEPQAICHGEKLNRLYVMHSESGNEFALIFITAIITFLLASNL